MKEAVSKLRLNSSWAMYKDPYIPNGSLLYALRNKRVSYLAMRQMEQEFKEFSSIKSNIDSQFKNIYRSVYKAYKRNDRVDLFKGLNEHMYLHACELRKANQ